MEGYRLFRKDRLGRKRYRVALSMGEQLKCLEVSNKVSRADQYRWYCSVYLL